MSNLFALISKMLTWLTFFTPVYFCDNNAFCWFSLSVFVAVKLNEVKFALCRREFFSKPRIVPLDFSMSSMSPNRSKYTWIPIELCDLCPKFVFREASTQNERYTSDEHLIAIAPLLYLSWSICAHSYHFRATQRITVRLLESVLLYFFCLFGLLQVMHILYLMVCGLWQLSIVWVT